MAAALPGLEDRLVELLEGTASGVTRAIAAGIFEHSPYNPNVQLSASAVRPYPFEIVREVTVDAEGAGFDVPTTAAATNIYGGATLTVRVGIMPRPHDAFERMQDIDELDYQIRRCVADPVSWGNTTGFSGVRVGDGLVVAEDVAGSAEAGEPSQMMVLELPVTLIFREDHS